MSCTLFALCSLPFGRFLRLQSVGKNLFVRKTRRCSGNNLFSLRACGLGVRVSVLFWEKPILGKPFDACRGRWPFLRLHSAVNLRKTPLREKTFIWLCSSSARYLLSTNLREISAALVGCCWKNPSWGKPFLVSFISGKPFVVLGKTCLLLGAYRGRSPFLALYSLPFFGRYLRLQSVVVGKNPSWEKTFSWCEETHSYFGKNLFMTACL